MLLRAHSLSTAAHCQTHALAPCLYMGNIGVLTRKFFKFLIHGIHMVVSGTTLLYICYRTCYLHNGWQPGLGVGTSTPSMCPYTTPAAHHWHLGCHEIEVYHSPIRPMSRWGARFVLLPCKTHPNQTCDGVVVVLIYSEPLFPQLIPTHQCSACAQVTTSAQTSCNPVDSASPC